MPRHWSARVLHALVAIWFVLSVGEPSVAHFCPMHGGTLAEIAHVTPASHLGGGHGSLHHAEHTDRGGNHAGHHCSCINCCVGSASAALRAADVSFAAAWLDDTAVLLVAGDALPRSAAPHAQPLATGPPRV